MILPNDQVFIGSEHFSVSTLVSNREMGIVLTDQGFRPSAYQVLREDELEVPVIGIDPQWLKYNCDDFR